MLRPALVRTGIDRTQAARAAGGSETHVGRRVSKGAAEGCKSILRAPDRTIMQS